MNIYVGNLPYGIMESELESLFRKYGDVSNAIIITDKETGKSKGFGFVEMPVPNQAEAAITTLNDTLVKGRNIKVSKAKPKSERARKRPDSPGKTRNPPQPVKTNEEAVAVLHFWFEEIESQSWWLKDPEFDRTIVDRFAALHGAANRCELFHWRQTARGRLAEIIILDQFSRNMYRDTPAAFASDPLALALAQEAVARDIHKELASTQRMFLLMPYMHSESAVIHETAVTLFDAPGLEGNLEFELKHKAIIDRFGRYPHRNETLGRESTEEERLFLQEADSSF